ncbi:MAG: DUF1553 domain-containing protein, partial [Verrucomicrobia bacterium]|nr:DUF1553 domain-containing protein [Verrucomicrobiota bacterium]
IFASSRPAQVTIDAPELLNKNRAELAALKSRIKDSLANEWLAATPKLIAQLSRGTTADPRLGAMQKQIATLENEIIAIEAVARTKAIPLSQRERVGVRENAPANQPVSIHLPQPIARWSFDKDARDQLGPFHGELVGNATIRNGRLVLDGKGSFFRTAPLTRDLREKTLEAWVSPANLDQRGGGVISVESTAPHAFDALVFAEKDPRQWLAGSDFFHRTRALDGPQETAAPGEFIHVAIAYRADGTVSVFRNGALYGKPYKTADEPHAFPAGSGRVLIGLRHTGAGNGFFTGEIDEARLYDRALTAQEIAASFKTGPVGISAEEIAKAMTPEQNSRRAAFAAELVRVRAELQSKFPQTGNPGDDALSVALKDAQDNTANPLHAWSRLSKTDESAFPKNWAGVVREWREQLDATRQHNTQFTTEWDFAGGDDAKWFRAGAGLQQGAGAPGEFSIEPDGERVLNGLLPAGVFTQLLSQKHNGSFTSPRFKITSDFISVRAAGGKGAMVRVIVDNYPLGMNSIFPKADLTRDELGWVRLDTAYRKGSMAYLEFATADDLTRKGKPADAQGRSWFGVERVVFHDKDTPREEPLASGTLFADDAPKSAVELSARYERIFTDAIAAFKAGNMSESQRAFLDFFVRRGLLPVKLDELVSVAPLVAEFRKLEAEVPVARHAPGVADADSFDAPLLLRGEHTKPGEPVPRGYLEALGAKAFFPVAADVRRRTGESQQTRLVTSAATSGRLELANAIADARNPLTARVMVNRVWQHLYGRGLVPTVDNFGRLGEKPTHPELLDYLATRFVEDGWSFKKLIR